MPSRPARWPPTSPPPSRWAPAGLDDAEVLRTAMRSLGEHVIAHRERLAGYFAVAAETPAVRSDPFVRLSDRERELTERLLARRPEPAAADWRTRLLVARAVAAFRIWLDDAVTAGTLDPLGHLDEVLAAVSPSQAPGVRLTDPVCSGSWAVIGTSGPTVGPVVQVFRDADGAWQPADRDAVCPAGELPADLEPGVCQAG